MKNLFFLTVLFCSISIPTLADDTIISLEQVQAAPAYAENEKLVLRLAEDKVERAEKAGLVTEQEKTEIKGFMRSLPFRRILDVEIIFPGFPDGIGLCLEGNPSDFLSIEACAGTIVWITSLSLNAKSRFLRYNNIKKQGSKYKGWQLSMGPAVGTRSMAIFALFDVVGSKSVDAFLSMEATRWYSKHFGLSFQLDAGAMYLYGNQAWDDKTFSQRALPMGKLTIGLSF